MKFLPKADDILDLNLGSTRVPFIFRAHPDQLLRTARIPHSMSGEKSTVWRLGHSVPGGQEYALKIMNNTNRHPKLPHICDYLRGLRNLPGLECCDRICLTRENCGTIDFYSDLEFSVLMPWIKGTSWFDAHQDHSSTRSLSQWEAFQLARALTEVLRALETRLLIHGSLSPSNVLVSTIGGSVKVDLVGLEGLYGPELPSVVTARSGPFGYTHPSNMNKESWALSDRFSGGLLIAEMLGWWSSIVRQGLYSAECYFDPEELQLKESERFLVLHEAVSKQHRDLAALLKQVWISSADAASPSFEEWLAVLSKVEASKISYTWFTEERRLGQNIKPNRCWAHQESLEKKDHIKSAELNNSERMVEN